MKRREGFELPSAPKVDEMESAARMVSCTHFLFCDFCDMTGYAPELRIEDVVSVYLLDP